MGAVHEFMILFFCFSTFPFATFCNLLTLQRYRFLLFSLPSSVLLAESMRREDFSDVAQYGFFSLSKREKKIYSMDNCTVQKREREREKQNRRQVSLSLSFAAAAIHSLIQSSLPMSFSIVNIGLDLI